MFKSRLKLTISTTNIASVQVAATKPAWTSNMPIKIHSTCGTEITNIQSKEDECLDYCPLCECICEGFTKEVSDKDLYPDS